MYCVLSSLASRYQQPVSLRKCSCLTKYVAGKTSIKKSNGVSRQLCAAIQSHPECIHTTSSKNKNDFPGSHLEVSPALSKRLKNTLRTHWRCARNVPEILFGGSAQGDTEYMMVGFS